MKKYEVSKVKPFSFAGVNGYNTQNMLITQCDFPKVWYEGDYISSVYSDRLSNEKWEEAVEYISINRNPDGWTQVPKSELKAFAGTLFGQNVTGVRVIRYSNAGGFPIWRIDVYRKGENSPNNPVSDRGYYEDREWNIDDYGQKMYRIKY